MADYLPQAREIGECQHAFHEGVLETVHAELADLLLGRKPGREADDEVTVFDATGIAPKDIAVAAVAPEKAVAAGSGTRVVLDEC